MTILLATGLFLLAIVALIVGYILVRYVPIISRVFQEKPLFLPLKLDPVADGVEHRLRSPDGVAIAATHLPRRSPGPRRGFVVYCHEFLSDRWSYRPYVDWLRDEGFDVLTFDFRNHGDSGDDPDYLPLQWVTRHEVVDLLAALKCARDIAAAEAAIPVASADSTRDDSESPPAIVLFGVSRGGGAAIRAAVKRDDVRAVITDGAFPARETMKVYIKRWAHIFVRYEWLYRQTPNWLFDLLGYAARRRTARRLGCHYSNVGLAASRLSPRPWLAIHGEKDAYISVEIARALFDYAKPPKELWIVPKAKHNRCLEADPAAYRAKVRAFLAPIFDLPPPPQAPESPSELEADPNANANAPESASDPAIPAETLPASPSNANRVMVD